MINEKQSIGFEYTIETIDACGEVIDIEVVHNLMPAEGVDHVLNMLLKSGTQFADWYIGLYEGAYTPGANDTAATFPAQATECTAYDAAQRVVFEPGSISAGSIDNSLNKAEFVLSRQKTVYGGFISSSAAKGSTSGVLLSVVRFGSPKQLDAQSTLRVTAGFTMASI